MRTVRGPAAAQQSVLIALFVKMPSAAVASPCVASSYMGCPLMLGSGPLFLSTVPVTPRSVLAVLTLAVTVADEPPFTRTKGGLMAGFPIDGAAPVLEGFTSMVAS